MNGPGKTTDKTVGGYETETGLYEKLNKVQKHGTPYENALAEGMNGIKEESGIGRWRPQSSKPSG